MKKLIIIICVLCCLVRLSEESEYKIITAKNGYHISVFAAVLKLDPVVSPRVYSRFCVAFLPHANIDKLTKQLDKNNDYVISRDELFVLY